MRMQETVVAQRNTSLFWLMVLLLIGSPLISRMVVEASWLGYLQGFSMMFISVLLEALPFVLLGAAISSLIHLQLNAETLARFLPKSYWLGLCTSALLGFVFPVCECAIVPITRGLLRKGVPTSMAVTFLLAVPIVNPVVLASTQYAFAGAWGPVLLRAVCGFLVAVFVGDYLGNSFKSGSPLRTQGFYDIDEHEVSCSHSHGHTHNHSADSTEGATSAPALWRFLQHTSAEFFAVGRYLIIGAALSATLQTFVPRQWLATIGQHRLLSVVALMVLAYGLSLCSEADAFIARTFVGHFSTGAILAFLVLGPMLDLKGTLLLSGAFSKPFVKRLAATVTLAVFGLGLLANAFFL